MAGAAQGPAPAPLMGHRPPLPAGWGGRAPSTLPLRPLCHPHPMCLGSEWRGKLGALGPLTPR